MTTERDRPLIFQEVQQFRQRWLWLVLLGLSALVLALTATSILGSGNESKPLWILGLVIVVFIANTVLFAILKLNTEVNADGVLIHYFPLKRRWIPRDRIQSATVRTYRPLRDYGGWGIRQGWRSIAYTVRGDRGVWLELTHGKPILLGSQQPEALATAIASLLPSD